MSEYDWIDEEDGPVVRPYTLTGGRVAEDTGEFDLVSVVEPTGEDPPSRFLPAPEHDRILRLCAGSPSVAEIASDLDLALGVVRVLLGDLLDHGLIRVRRPASVARFPKTAVLKEVIDGLRAL